VEPEITTPGEVEPQTTDAGGSSEGVVSTVSASTAPVEPSPPSQAEKLFAEGESAMKSNDFLKARTVLSQAVQLGLDDQQEHLARKLLNQASDEWLFSKKIFEGDTLCQRYKVQSGDRLVKIGKNYHVPYQLLMKINGITDPTKLHAGELIKVVKGPFHVMVERSQFRLSLYLGEILVRTYPVGLGKPGRQTPTGLWLVKEGKKQVNPGWPDRETGRYYYPDDPENPLGERWIGLEGLEGAAKGREGFGIHGTIKPDEIGKAASRGCIRLYNGDAEELYDLLQEGQSQVQVVE
jgi:lipoprotein-anchoring transpeptidase ErfK/SrfK